MLAVLVGPVQHFKEADYPDAPHRGSGLSIRATVQAVFAGVFLKLHPRGEGGEVCPDDVAEVVARIGELVRTAPERLASAKALHGQMEAEAAAKRSREEAEWAPIDAVLMQRDVAGAGASAIVYKGKLDGQMVAIKEMRANAPKVVAKQFANEVEILSALCHRNVLRCLRYVARSAAERYIVMPLADQGSLGRPGPQAKALLSDGRTLVKALLGAAEGLAYLHAQRIVHRDVKCALRPRLTLPIIPGISGC